MFQKLALLLLSTTVSLVLLEFCVRELIPSYHPKQQIIFYMNKDGVPLGPANQTVRQRTPKGDYDLMVSFNYFGFRDSKQMHTSTASDWFVLGDSFGMGWGVEETDRFSDVWDAMVPFRVFNISIGGVDIEGYTRLLDYAGQNVPTIRNLVVAVCMENDFRDYYRKHPTTAHTKRSVKARIRAYAKTHSALYLLLSYKLQQFPMVKSFLEAIGIARRVDNDELMRKNEFNKTAILYSVDLLQDIIDGRKNTVVLIIPSRALWIGDNRDIEQRVHAFFVNELRKRNIEILDMRPLLEAAGDPMRYYFTTDPHWNEDGHRLAATALYTWITSAKKLR